MVKLLSSWLAEQGIQGSKPGLATLIFRYWVSPASKLQYDPKIVHRYIHRYKA